MNDIILNIEKTFSAKPTSCYEKGLVFSANLITKILPSYEQVNTFSENISDRDDYEITFINPDDDVISLTRSNVNFENHYQSFVDNLEANDKVSIVVKINKKIENNYFSIYNWELFSSIVTNDSLLELISTFNFLLKDKEMLYFEVFDKEIFWATKTMIFTNNIKIIKNCEFNRNDYLNACRETTYFYNSIEFNVLPDDFLIITDYAGNPFTEKFYQIATLFSIVYVSTNSSIENGMLNCQISGQRNMNFSYNIDTIKINKEIIKIFKWIYTDGNSIDKALIVRNILSLHCKFSDLINIDFKTFSSIQSNYKIYLKGNVDNYLNAKEKVTEFICNITMKIGDDIASLLNGFKSNIFAIFGTLLTITISNILSEQSLDNIFTKDVILIFRCILYGSYIYLVICLFDAKYRLSKNKLAYENLKSSYEEIFSVEDFSNIFNKDIDFLSAKKSFEKGIIVLTIIWVLIITFMIEFLYFIEYFRI